MPRRRSAPPSEPSSAHQPAGIPACARRGGDASPTRARRHPSVLRLGFCPGLGFPRIRAVSRTTGLAARRPPDETRGQHMTAKKGVQAGAEPVMTGWRVCGATGAGLISYSRLGDPVARVQDAVCDQGCATIPGPGCECGWYVCESLADIRPLVATHQYHVDHGADHVDLALVGVEITHPRHTPSPFNNRKGRALARRIDEIAGVRHLTSIEGDGTYRGRQLTITGPIVTTLSNSAAIERLHRNYETDVISTPLRMLDVVDLLHAAGGTHGHTLEDLTPHLHALLTPAKTPTPRRPAMPTAKKAAPVKKAAPARKPRPVATADHLAAGKSTDGGWTGTLGGAEIRVLPFGQWTKDAMTALNMANFDRWAEGALHPDDVSLFIHADVKMGDVMAFMRQAGSRARF